MSAISREPSLSGPALTTHLPTPQLEAATRQTGVESNGAVVSATHWRVAVDVISLRKARVWNDKQVLRRACLVADDHGPGWASLTAQGRAVGAVTWALRECAIKLDTVAARAGTLRIFPVDVRDCSEPCSRELCAQLAQQLSPHSHWGHAHIEFTSTRKTACAAWDQDHDYVTAVAVAS